MDNPALAARRILFGTGIGLLLIVFLSMREERLPLEANIGWSILIAALLVIIVAYSIPLDSEFLIDYTLVCELGTKNRG